MWQARRLVELRSRTRDGDEVFEVVATSTSSGPRVESESSFVVAPPTVGSSNALWHVAMLDRTQAIDAQNGGIIGLVAGDRGSERIDVRGNEVAARRCQVITPNVTGASGMRKKPSSAHGWRYAARPSSTSWRRRRVGSRGALRTPGRSWRRANTGRRP